MHDELHTYHSTACLHREHALCKGYCKFCAERCICLCHRGKPVIPPPNPDASTITDVNKDRS
jgi:hypothetical protein